MSKSRYARQIAVPGVGPSGQAAFAGAEVSVAGQGLAAEVCALYLAGAGVGTLTVAPAFAEPCRRLSSEVRVIPSVSTDAAEKLEVLVAGRGGERARFSPEPSGDPVRDGAIAARWALARALSQRTGDP